VYMPLIHWHITKMNSLSSVSNASILIGPSSSAQLESNNDGNGCLQLRENAQTTTQIKNAGPNVRLWKMM